MKPFAVPAQDQRPCHVALSDIRLALDGREVLRGVTLDLTERRIGIVGRNGSGKTSLVRVLCGLIGADEGTVRVNGVDVLKDRRGALAEIGIIFQNPDHQIIFPTVGEEIAFGPRQQGHDKAAAHAIAREALARFGVSDWVERSVASLSQGQKHLVCLMSVLAMRPAVIVLDEPFTGLDLPTARQLRRHLGGLAETVIQITHDLSALEGYERVLWIDEGRIADDGPAVDVLARYHATMTEIAEQADAVIDLSR